jgi:hypothetical protein
MKTLLMLVFAGCLTLAGNASAQYLTGSVNGEVLPFDPYGYATSSSMGLFPTNIVDSAAGSFAGIAKNSVVMNFYYGTVSGLSTAPTTVNINNFLLFSQDDMFGGYQASGTTPMNRFEFNLATLTENSYDSSTGAALFTGTGTIVDITGAYQNTPADLTVTFSGGPNNPYSGYTFTVDAVPEPATISLAAAGLLGLLALRRRQSSD